MSAFIQCVSIPRSGHHLLVRLLRSYYRSSDKHSRTFFYCGHYKSCKTHPCSCLTRGIVRFRKNRPEPLVILQKSHDRHMPFPGSNEPKFWGVSSYEEPDLRVSLDHDYIIQIRDPIMSIISDYPLSCGEFTTVDKWLQFAESGMLYRKAFLEKWILQNEYIETERYHVVRYEDMVDDPEVQLRKVIRYISPTRAIDTDALERVFEKHPIRAKWSLDSFVFLDTVSALETVISDVWERTTSITEKLVDRDE